MYGTSSYVCTYVSLYLYCIQSSVVLVSKNLFSISYSYLHDERNQDFSFSYSMLPICRF